MPAGSGVIQLWAAEEAILSSRLEWAGAALAAAGGTGRRRPPSGCVRLAGRRGDGTGVMAAYLELVRTWPYDEAYLAEASERPTSSASRSRPRS